MSKYKSKSFLDSFKNALRGIRLLWKSEKNFRTHSLIALLVLVLAGFVGFGAEEIAILVMMIGIVLICEMINSAIEYTLDAVYKNKYSKLVGMAKDIAAGAVTLSAFTSIVVGVLMFVNQIFD
ncbi:diacylglycerol kinase family protein [bacterium]|nr:diacylglycerol kinase family protein [bacterium]